MTGLLEVENLAVTYPRGVEALRGVSFSLERGRSLAVVGESGAGKSSLALCLAGLVQPPEARGSVRIGGTEMLGATAEVLRSLRWATVALALQGAPFNPVATVGSQVEEPLRERAGMSARAARKRARELAVEVVLDPALLDSYPHQISGGERRRAMLAMVLALDPALVVLDEPTAGVDPANKAELVERIVALAEQRGFALLSITHDLSDAARLAERMMVLYAGEVMEAGGTAAVIDHPQHPYSWALLSAYPVMSTTKDLRPIRGQPPDPRAVPQGCPFRPRCTQAEPVCETHPPLVESQGRDVACHFGGLKALLSAEGISKGFRTSKRQVQALGGVSLELREGESLGVIGPSGSGKSTLARILTGHLVPDAGRVFLEGHELSFSWRNRNGRDLRKRIQLVAQDPWDALSPRLTVEELVREPLDLIKGHDKAARREVVASALDSVGLPASGEFLGARTHQLSGGQLQRIALARALVLEPKVIVADEPTAMLDASEQARLLLLLRERQVESGIGLVLVSHDMAVVRKVTDRILVLDRGQVVEEGPSHVVSSSPRSLTTRRLIAAAPVFAPDALGAAGKGPG